MGDGKKARDIFGYKNKQLKFQLECILKEIQNNIYIYIYKYCHS